MTICTRCGKTNPADIHTCTPPGMVQKQIWNDAIDAVIELLRLHPPSRIGEAAFMRRLINLRETQDEQRD